MRNRVSWIVALLLASALGLMVATVEARDHDDDDDAEHHEGPAIEAVALHHQPAHAALETIEQMRRYALQIMAFSVRSDAMPLGNETGMTREERDMLGAWVSQQ